MLIINGRNQMFLMLIPRAATASCPLFDLKREGICHTWESVLVCLGSKPKTESVSCVSLWYLGPTTVLTRNTRPDRRTLTTICQCCTIPFVSKTNPNGLCPFWTNNLHQSLKYAQYDENNIPFFLWKLTFYFDIFLPARDTKRKKKCNTKLCGITPGGRIRCLYGWFHERYFLKP